MATKKVKTTKKKKKAVNVPSRGQAHIQATYNNTIITLTDANGNTVSWSSAGKMGFKGPKKATAYAASIIVKDAATRATDRGMKEVDVYVKGVGAGRESAIRSINANGIEVMSIRDITPVPHNGCRPPKPRRV